MAKNDLPRVDKVSVKLERPAQMFVKFKGVGLPQEVDLSGWIATGGDMLRDLVRPEVFANAKVIDHGATVTWDDGEGDLSIDAPHLKMIADEQKPFSREELKGWQEANNVSNAEAADFVGVSPSTWATYKVDANIPRTIAITIRATQRDPLLLQAHLRPRTTGRPRKEA